LSRPSPEKKEKKKYNKLNTALVWVCKTPGERSRDGVKLPLFLLEEEEEEEEEGGAIER